VSVPVPDTPDGQSPHSLMDDRVFSDVEEGKGVKFGTRVHEFAEQYAQFEPVEPSNADERNVKDFLDGLPGDLRAEENAYLPVAVGDDRVTISGIIDLLHVTDNRVDIIDYKTDRGRHAESEYRKQLSVYHHVVRAAYPDRRVTASLFYTADGERVEVDPLTRDDITQLVDESKKQPLMEEGEPPHIH
jgi:ATP-dependent exoDNAse (exonuclease V) beta subunit